MVRLLEGKKEKINVLTIFALATLGLHILALFFLIIQGMTIRQLNNRKPPALVQLVDGQPVLTADSSEREPEEISQFVTKTMSAMFEWSGNLPPQTVEQLTNPKPDLGLAIKTPQGFTKQVPTTSWVASFGLSEDFRQGFLAQIADMVPADVFSRNVNQAMGARLVVQRVYPPQKIEPGKWRVGMVANIVQFRRSNNQKILTPFNKDFFVRSVDAYEHPLAQQITPLQKSAYSVRSQKLEIYEITDLCLLPDGNCKK